MIAVNATAKTQAWLNLAEEEVPQLVATATSVYDMLTDSSIQSTMSEMTNLFVQAYYLAQIERPIRFICAKIQKKEWTVITFCYKNREITSKTREREE